MKETCGSKLFLTLNSENLKPEINRKLNSLIYFTSTPKHSSHSQKIPESAGITLQLKTVPVPLPKDKGELVLVKTSLSLKSLSIIKPKEDTEVLEKHKQ